MDERDLVTVAENRFSTIDGENVVPETTVRGRGFGQVHETVRRPCSHRATVNLLARRARQRDSIKFGQGRALLRRVRERYPIIEIDLVDLERHEDVKLSGDYRWVLGKLNGL